jgi:DNA-binding IclR family transcriptional regulator
MLGILDLFDSQDAPIILEFEQLHERLGYNRSTLYRYLKALTDAGLLWSFPSLGYVLGPRIIQLDYRSRVSDPLIRMARPAMQHVAREFGGVALLCRWYKFDVICVHQESGTDLIASHYERGCARSLLRGAASLAILAQLPTQRLQRLYQGSAQAFAQAGLGTSLEEVKVGLRAHRQRGWVGTTGEVTPGVTGVAAPVFEARNKCVGSLSITLPEARATPERVARAAEQIMRQAQAISEAMERASLVAVAAPPEPAPREVARAQAGDAPARRRSAAPAKLR